MQQLDVLVAEVAPQLFSNILSLAEAHFGELSIYFISHVVLRLMVWYASWPAGVSGLLQITEIP